MFHASRWGLLLTGRLVGSAAVASGDRFVRRESAECGRLENLDNEEI